MVSTPVPASMELTVPLVTEMESLPPSAWASETLAPLIRMESAPSPAERVLTVPAERAIESFSMPAPMD